jgi:ATP/maltotriose-dependent transcriptional regulator MalT
MARSAPTHAKLARPASAALVPRPRLFARLDRGPAVTWLCGPPGSGKSALAASYLEARRRASAWYQIDARDADLATFFYYLGLLARQIAPGKRPLPAFSPAFARGAPAFTRRFFEGFFPRCPRPFTLVLDDYDALPPPAPLHEVFAELVAAIPPGCRLIVIGREEPPPSLARFRGSGALAVLGGL